MSTVFVIPRIANSAKLRELRRSFWGEFSGGESIRSPRVSFKMHRTLCGEIHWWRFLPAFLPEGTLCVISLLFSLPLPSKPYQLPIRTEKPTSPQRSWHRSASRYASCTSAVGYFNCSLSGISDASPAFPSLLPRLADASVCQWKVTKDPDMPPEETRPRFLFSP